MALFNYATKEITLKLVYYGPGLSGKTTNLKYLHDTMSPDRKGKLLSLATEADRTLFFDFMPVSLGRIKDFNVRFQLYTVPGQVRYNATRKLVLKGADAVVFVADSQEAMKEQNIESFENMRENLVANNINPDDIPIVLQYNKRDLKNVMPIDELEEDLNRANYRFVEAVAINGTGVEETFKLTTTLLLRHISKKHSIQLEEPEGGGESILPKAAPSPAPAAEIAAPAAAPEQPAAVSWGGVEFSDTEMEKEIIEAALPEEEPVEVEEAAADLTEKDWTDLLEVHGKQGAPAEAGPAMPVEPAGWPAAGEMAEETPVEKGSQGDSPFEVDEEEPLWTVDEGPAIETAPAADIMEETAAPAFPEVEERSHREGFDVLGRAPLREAAQQVSISTERLEEMLERVAQNTGAAVDALGAFSGLSAELRKMSSLGERLASLDEMATTAATTNELFTKLLEEIKDLKKHQVETLQISKKVENYLKIIAGAALEAKAKKSGFKLFGK